MHKLVLSAALCTAMMGAAFAQVEASSSTYLLDIDPARYAGPAGQRLLLTVGDQPRHVVIGSQDEICVQLQRVAGNSEVISARVRVLRPQPQPAAEVRVVAPDISPGTYRSTPWGLLLRAVPNQGSMMKTAVTTPTATPAGSEVAAACTL